MLVETVLVADDVALAANIDYAGRRGIAGTVLVHKIAGAAAAEGKDLPQVASIAQAVADNLGTMGVSLSAGTAPGVGKPSFTLDGEVELGLGIHGEPGVRRIPLKPADEIVDELLRPIERSLRLRAGERIVVLLNNLGATTNMELAIIARKVLLALRAKDYIVERVFAGTFVSSLEMAGVSISLLRVNDERLRWLDAPTQAPAWPRVSKREPGEIAERIIPSENDGSAREERATETPAGRQTQRAVVAACDALLEAEEQLTELDRLAGDGDLGSNMARAARAIKEGAGTYLFDRPAEAFRELGLSLQQLLGGSSGPLYGVFFLRAGAGLDGGPVSDPKVWAQALLDACGAISELGGAALGDRTMLDALLPFAQSFDEQIRSGVAVREALLAAFELAKQGAQSTANMTARRGRSSYLGTRVMGTPDPGAVAVIVWLRAVVGTITS
jgi:dihydroxyacetone kinase